MKMEVPQATQGLYVPPSPPYSYTAFLLLQHKLDKSGCSQMETGGSARHLNNKQIASYNLDKTTGE